MRRFSSFIFPLHFHEQQLQIVIHIDVILNLSIYLSEYLVCSFIHFIHSFNGKQIDGRRGTENYHHHQHQHHHWLEHRDVCIHFSSEPVSQSVR